MTWATKILGFLLEGWLKAWEERNLDRHGRDAATKSQIATAKIHSELAHLYSFRNEVPQDLQWLFSTPLDECIQQWSLRRMRAWISNWTNIITKDYATQLETG